MKSFFPHIKGYVGERRIRQLLEKLGEEYTIFNDLYVPKKDGKLTQIDHLVVSPYGIFVIETKNYTGWIFGQEQQRNWTQTIYQNKSRFYNPIMQNQTHIKALQHYIDVDVPMHSVIVFSNAATLKFKEPFQTAQVIQNRQLKRTIKRYSTPLISTEQLNYMTHLLQSLVPTSSKQKREIKNMHLQHVKKVSSAGKSKSKRTQSKLDGKSTLATKDKITNGNMTSKMLAPAEVLTATPTDHEVVTNTVALDEQIVTMEEKLTTTMTPREKDSASITDLCPKCGSYLTVRKGKFGVFYGCQAFPKCRFTKPASEVDKNNLVP